MTRSNMVKNTSSLFLFFQVVLAVVVTTTHAHTIMNINMPPTLYKKDGYPHSTGHFGRSGIQLSDAGFKVNNPNASRSCGCGTSFEAADEKPGANAVPDGEACGD